MAEGHLSVDFIGEDDLLALVGVVFADAGTGKKRIAVDVARGGGLLCGLAARLPRALAVGVLLLGVALLYFDGESLAGYFLSVDSAAGTANVECAFGIGLDDVGEAGGGGVRHLSVDDGHALLP